MTRLLFVPVLAASLGLSACGIVDMPSRNHTPFDGSLTRTPITSATPDPGLTPHRGFVVEEVRVSVPDDLRVSEANVYFPLADIVWRGDPYGDRPAQVQEIFEDAFAKGTASLSGGPKVVVDVAVRRFHAVTEKARYTIGGVHSMRFVMTVRDAATGAVLMGPKLVSADMRASGGVKAIAEDARGYTQRVAVTRHLAEVVARELASPDTPLASPVLSSRGSDSDVMSIATVRADF